MPYLSHPLYVNGVDQLFLDLVRPQLQLLFIIQPSAERKLLSWSIQFVDAKRLEERYVTTLMADTSDRDIYLMKPAQLEEYLSNRFRSYMQRFKLFNADESPFELNAFLNHNQVELVVSGGYEPS